MKISSLIKYLCRLWGILTVISLTSCRDDYFDNLFNDKGDDVTIDVDFMPMATSSLRTRGSLPGDGMSDLRDLCLVLFDGTTEKFDRLVDLTDLTCTETSEQRDDNDTSNGKPTTEISTIRRKYNLKLPTGKYYVYAVANLGVYSTGSNASKSTEAILGEIGIEDMTRSDFKRMRRPWDTTDFRNNSEMAGICTVGQLPGGSVYTGMTDDLPINLYPGVNLHCWLRRLASKVTVDFDASSLNASTTIYLKEIRIKDIPFDCSIIDKNTAYHSSLGDPLKPENMPGGLLSEEKNQNYIRLCDDSDATDNETGHVNWPYLTAGLPTLQKLVEAFDDTDKTFPQPLKNRKETLLSVTHANDAPSLFFYENMHGKDANRPKAPDADNDGVIDSPGSFLPEDPDYKDAMPGGTYIEVEGYYVSVEKGNEGEGTIIYRFMLGKDTVDDYDAERNYHYKLTLSFNGYANDVDWHIEYDRDKPPYSIPDEYYISYGYNEMTELPVTISGELKDGIITAEVVRNDWQPSIMWMDYHPTTYPNGNSSFSPYAATETAYPPNDTEKLSLGFLSLRKPQNDVLGASQAANYAGMLYLWNVWISEPLDAGDHSRNKYTDDTRLYHTQYYGVQAYGGRRALGYRVFYFPEENYNPQGVQDLYYGSETRPEYADNEDGGYRCHTIAPKSSASPRQTTLYIPMYTRERNLIKGTGYTGENPYKNFQRRAALRIRFIVKDRHNKEHLCDKTIPIIQVAKLGNPMGIWRDWNNAAPFQVQLKYLNDDDLTFSDLTSHEGGWSAEVERGADWILLNGGRQKVNGTKDSKIAFSVRPAGILSNKNQVRCGIITVRYHNYSCIHKIFVRQGYAPLRLNSDGPAYHTGNLVTKDSEASNPCDEGSMFRVGNLDDPIDASNNVNDVTPWAKVTPNMFKDHSDTDFKIAGRNETKKWNEIESIGSYKDGQNYSWPAIIINGKKAKLMSIKDIVQLRDGNNGNTDLALYQYGVLYSDDATTTASTVESAWHYRASDPSTHTYGMRGCFIYNKSDGKQIFFPIGASGFGIRKSGRGTTLQTVPDETGYVSNQEIGTAVLRYSAARYTYNNAADTRYRPLLWDIFRSEGAVYWADKAAPDDPNFTSNDNKYRTAADLNFKTFDFNTLGEELFVGEKSGNGSDACFIRLVDE